MMRGIVQLRSSMGLGAPFVILSVLAKDLACRSGKILREYAQDDHANRILWVFGGVASLILSSSARAAPTNEEFFQSVRENIDKPVDPTRFIAGMLVVVGVVLLLVLFSRKKEERAARPKVLNHPGKLLKEVVSAVHIKPAELKQLKLLSEGQNVSSPLTLLLCPSVFAKAVRAKTSKVDRRVLAQLAKKLVQLKESPQSIDS